MVLLGLSLSFSMDKINTDCTVARNWNEAQELADPFSISYFQIKVHFEAIEIHIDMHLLTSSYAHELISQTPDF